MTREHAYSAIAAIEGAAFLLADATSRETELADQRALVKDAGIARLRASGVASSVTAAEKVIELDAEYMHHRENERHAVAARIVMQGKLEAAKLRARLAVELAAIDEPLKDADVEDVTSSDVEPKNRRLEHTIEKIDMLLDGAGIIDKGADEKYLGVVDRVELLVSQTLERETA